MLTILLVDDDPDEFELLQSACENINEVVKITLADSCKELFDEFNKHKPDIIFMDINLPAMNGIQCLKLIRADKLYKSLPVIMYSTSDNKSTIEESYLHEANFYIVKPETIQGIEKILRKVLQLDWNKTSKPAFSNFVL